MDLNTFPSAADFLAAVAPALVEAEAVNGLIYGLALTLYDLRQVIPPPQPPGAMRQTQPPV